MLKKEQETEDRIQNAFFNFTQIQPYPIHKLLTAPPVKIWIGTIGRFLAQPVHLLLELPTGIYNIKLFSQGMD